MPLEEEIEDTLMPEEEQAGGLNPFKNLHYVLNSEIKKITNINYPNFPYAIQLPSKSIKEYRSEFLRMLNNLAHMHHLSSQKNAMSSKERAKKNHIDDSANDFSYISQKLYDLIQNIKEKPNTYFEQEKNLYTLENNSGFTPFVTVEFDGPEGKKYPFYIYVLPDKQIIPAGVLAQRIQNHFRKLASTSHYLMGSTSNEKFRAVFVQTNGSEDAFKNRKIRLIAAFCKQFGKELGTKKVEELFNDQKKLVATLLEKNILSLSTLAFDEKRRGLHSLFDSNWKEIKINKKTYYRIYITATKKSGIKKGLTSEQERERRSISNSILSVINKGRTSGQQTTAKKLFHHTYQESGQSLTLSEADYLIFLENLEYITLESAIGNNKSFQAQKRTGNIEEITFAQIKKPSGEVRYVFKDTGTLGKNIRSKIQTALKEDSTTHIECSFITGLSSISQEDYDALSKQYGAFKVNTVLQDMLNRYPFLAPIDPKLFLKNCLTSVHEQSRAQNQSDATIEALSPEERESAQRLTKIFDYLVKLEALDENGEVGEQSRTAIKRTLNKKLWLSLVSRRAEVSVNRYQNSTNLKQENLYCSDIKKFSAAIAYLLKSLTKMVSMEILTALLPIFFEKNIISHITWLYDAEKNCFSLTHYQSHNNAMENRIVIHFAAQENNNEIDFTVSFSLNQYPEKYVSDPYNLFTDKTAEERAISTFATRNRVTFALSALELLRVSWSIQKIAPEQQLTAEDPISSNDDSVIEEQAVSLQQPRKKTRNAYSEILTELAINKLSQSMPLLLAATKHIPHLVIANSGIKGANKGLYLAANKEALVLEKGTIISFYNGIICHTDDLAKFAMNKNLSFNLVESYTCSLCAQSAAGTVIVGDALPGENGPNYNTVGPVSFANCASNPNTYFSVTPHGVLLRAKTKLVIEQSKALELTVSYGSSLAHQPALQGLTRAQLKYHSHTAPFDTLTGITAIGSLDYVRTSHYQKRIQEMRDFCKRSQLSVPKDITDKTLLSLFDQGTAEKSWKSILQETYPVAKKILSDTVSGIFSHRKHPSAEGQNSTAKKRQLASGSNLVPG